MSDSENSIPSPGAAEADTWGYAEAEMARAVSGHLMRRAGESDDAWAQRVASAALSSLCSYLGGNEWYIPRLPAHHRARRDTQLRLDFDGGNLDKVAETAALSSRHTRRIVQKR